MTAARRSGRRTAVMVTAVAAAVLTTGLMTGCDEVDGSTENSSFGCLRNAGTIADSLKAIHEAGLDAAEDPERTEQSIDTIETNLDRIDKVDGGTADDKVVLDGDATPDAGRIDAAAEALKNVCTP